MLKKSIRGLSAPATVTLLLCSRLFAQEAASTIAPMSATDASDLLAALPGAAAVGTPATIAPVPTAPAPADGRVKFYAGYFPSRGQLLWKADFSGLAARDKVTAVRLVVAPEGRRSEVAGARLEPKEFAVEAIMEVPRLEDGQYEARLYLEGLPDDDRPSSTIFFTQKASFPWIPGAGKLPLGGSDSVVPPFTPILLTNNHVGVIGRDHELTRLGLWQQVESDGLNLLDGPMSLQTLEGFEPLSHMQVLSSTASKLVTSADFKFPNALGRLTSEWDYDGMMKVSLELFGSSAKTGQLNGLDLLIPLRDEQAKLMHWTGVGQGGSQGLSQLTLPGGAAGGTVAAPITGSAAVPPGEGEIWNSFQAASVAAPGAFLPYLYLGNEARGVSWFASNDTDWILDSAHRTPHLTLERHGGQLLLRVHLIQMKANLGRNRKIVFGLQATPVKPMPLEWRRTIAPALDAAMPGASQDAAPGTPPDSSSTRGKPQAAAVFNIRQEDPTSEAWRAYHDEWQPNYPPEATQTESAATDAHRIAPVDSRADYLLWQLSEKIKGGTRGVYWVGLGLAVNGNPLLGAGYARRDNVWMPDNDLWQLRNLARRTAVMLHDQGVPGSFRGTNREMRVTPIGGWGATALLPDPVNAAADFQDNYPRDALRAWGLGLQTGTLPVLDGLGSSSENPARARSRVAVAVPHELALADGVSDATYVAVRTLLRSLGYGQDATVYHYWDAHPVARVTGLDAAWMAVRGKDAAGKPVTALFLGDYGNGGVADVKLDVERLGLVGAFTARNGENDEESVSGSDGHLLLPRLAKHDFRLWLLSASSAAAAETVKPAAPPGVFIPAPTPPTITTGPPTPSKPVVAPQVILPESRADIEAPPGHP